MTGYRIFSKNSNFSKILNEIGNNISFTEFRVCCWEYKTRQATYTRNTEARSRNNSCRGKAVSITYFGMCVCVCVCLCVCRRGSVSMRVPGCVCGCGCTVEKVCLRACNLTYPAALWLHHNFRHYLINGTILGKRLLNTKCVFWLPLQLLFETFLILRKFREIVSKMGKSLHVH